MFVVSILLLSLVMGCITMTPLPEKKPSTFPINVYISDSSSVEGNVNITVWIDNVTVYVWDHPMIPKSPNVVSAEEMKLSRGPHTIRAFEKNQNVTNSTAFNLNTTLYIVVNYFHSDDQSHLTLPTLTFFLTDSPVGFD